MPAYVHTQTGTVFLVAAGLLSALLVALALGGAVESEEQWILWMTLVPIAAAAHVFRSLTIAVRDDRVAWHFSSGLWRREVSVHDIAEHRIVSNTLLHGWGVRLLWRGWLYSVSGRQAVELTLHSGRVVWLGTDDPEGLDRAVAQALAEGAN